MRFTLTPRLRDALARGRALIDDACDDAKAFATAEREGSIELSEVVTLSKLLQSACSSDEKDASAAAAAKADAHSPSPQWLHELLLGAAPVLPARAERAPAHPSLAPRLAVLRAAQEDRDYAKMVGSGMARDEDAAARDVAEMATYRSQMGVGLNLLVSMATMFTVGAYAGGTADEPFGIRAVICGLALMLLAMAIEMSLFLIGAVRVDAKVHKRETRAKARGVTDRTKLRSVPGDAADGAANGAAANKKQGVDLRSIGHSVHVE